MLVEESVQDKLVGPDHVLSYSRAMDMVWILTEGPTLLGEKETCLHVSVWHTLC